MGTRKNKTRLGEWDFTIQKPMANDVVMRNGLFVSLQNGYIVPATPQLPIEGCAINDRYSGENNEHRYCIYQPKRNWETFTMEVENGTLKQADVGKTFRIVGVDQHINYSTKADFGGQFRLEEVLNDNLGTFTYNFDVQFAPQGPQGNDGETPSLQIGTVTKLQPDQNPTAQLVQDPDDPNMYTLNLGIPAGSQGPRGYQGDKGDTGNTGSAGQNGANGTNGQDGQDGADGISPHREGNWNGGQTYTKLAIVRYPDSDNVYRTWITNADSIGETPGVSANRKKMNRDGETGPQGDQGSVIAIPVEGKPGKDGVGINGKDGKDGATPHDEGERVNYRQYSPLSMVRAFTGEYDQRGNEIRGYYVTQNGAAAGEQPNDPDSEWQLVAKDGQAGDGNPYCAMIGLGNGIDRIGRTFNANGNLDTDNRVNDVYTGNKAMVINSGLGIVIRKQGHYRIFGHCIIQANTGANKLINLGRYSIILYTARSGSASSKFMATSKMGGPAGTSSEQGPWFDFHIDIQMDLYEGDILKPVVRLQSDDPAAAGQSAGTYRIIGADDTSGDDPDGQSIGGFFPTYMGVEYVSAHLWQTNDPEKIVGDI